MVNNQRTGPHETEKQGVFGFSPWLSFNVNHESDLTSVRARLTDWTEGAGGDQVFQVESDLEWRPQGKQVPCHLREQQQGHEQGAGNTQINRLTLTVSPQATSSFLWSRKDPLTISRTLTSVLHSQAWPCWVSRECRATVLSQLQRQVWALPKVFELVTWVCTLRMALSLGLPLLFDLRGGGPGV